MRRTDLPKLVDFAASLYGRYRDGDDKAIAAALKQAGADPVTIADLIAFIPLGFSRALLDESGVTFQPNYTVMNPETNEEASLPLAGEPAFAEAYALARRWREANMNGDLFTTIVTRSAEFRAINDALNNGSKLENLVASEPVILNSNWRPAGRKPWWKLW